MKSQPVNIPVSAGGRLMPDVSAEVVGLANWTVKRDLRRVLEREERAEGYVKFSALQPLTNGTEILLVAEARLANQKTVTVVGTAQKLWRYVAEHDTGYVSAGYCSAGYVDNASHVGEWLEIGSGFSGAKWEAWSVGNQLVLNNGVDLPMTYRPGDRGVTPVWELRELGVASVGTIAEFDSILVCGDLKQIVDMDSHFAMIEGEVDCGLPGRSGVLEGYGTLDDGTQQRGAGNVVRTPYTPLFAAGDVGKQVRLGCERRVITAYTSANQVTVNGPATTYPLTLPISIVRAQDWVLDKTAAELFPGEDETRLAGRWLTWDSGDTRLITAVDGNGNITVHDDYPIPSGAVSLEADAYGIVEGGKVEHYPWRTIWSLPGYPERFGAVYMARIAQGSRVAWLTAPPKGLRVGMQLMITGAGAGGGNLTSDILFATSNRVTLADASAAADPEGEDETTPAMAGDAVDSVTGKFLDMIGDGGRILRMLPLGNYLMVYKNTPWIYAMAFTRTITQPFTAEKLNEAPFSEGTVLRWPETLISVGGEYHVYAGCNEFYRLDLARRVPAVIDELQMCSDFFFAATGRKFGAENGLTKEVFFCCPAAAGPDKALRLDYMQGTASTTSMAITAAKTLHKPLSDDYWFVMAIGGVVMRYGLESDGTAVHNRDGAVYDSVLQSGLGDFGSGESRKVVTQYTPLLGEQSSDTPLAVTLRSGDNPSRVVEKITATIAKPHSENMLLVAMTGMYAGDKITVGGKDNPVSIASREFRVVGIGSKGWDRRKR